MEKKMLLQESAIATKQEDTVINFNDKFIKISTSIIDSANQVKINVSDIIDIKTAINEQQAEITTLKARVEAGDVALTALRSQPINNQLDEIAILKARLDASDATIASFKVLLDKGDPIARKESREALELANSVESHHRRWALRLIGRPAPPDNTQETTPQAKMIATQFLNETMNIQGFNASDIDCAHRVGTVSKEKKQTMLIRLFERDYVDLVITKRKMLKGSGFVIYEDASYINRTLVTALKRDPRVHSAWIAYGRVWAKKSITGKKFKVGMHDNIDLLLA
jgi:hypothetical protein